MNAKSTTLLGALMALTFNVSAQSSYSLCQTLEGGIEHKVESDSPFWVHSHTVQDFHRISEEDQIWLKQLIQKQFDQSGQSKPCQNPDASQLSIVPLPNGSGMRIYFGFDEAILNNKDKEKLLKLVTRLKTSSPSWTLEGHTDAIGSATYNNTLSLERARTVKTFLMDAGMEQEALTLKSFGENSPIADNQSEEGRRMNRRVDIISGN